LADTIVRRENLSFKNAHKIVGNCVKAALAADGEITHAILQDAAKAVINRELAFTADELKDTLTAEYFVSIRTIYGGTAPDETRRALSVERENETADADWFRAAGENLENAGSGLQKEVDKVLGS
jgi:argininosuccinate lyase